MNSDQSIKVAVLIYDYSTSGVSHSGGRYHALMLAFALAHSDIDVTVVCDQIPAVADDLAHDYGSSVRFVCIPTFDPALVPGKFNFVFIAPTGGFNPAFYACAEVLAGRSAATPVLINYESANWFNAVAPTPDHLSVWDYWRRTVVQGGIVLSSTIEAERYARDYYRSDKTPVHFDTCYPPLNSRAAMQASIDAGVKDGGLLYFARPFHDHKGGQDILDLPSGLFARRVLRVIVGGSMDEWYFVRLKAKLDACGGRLEIHSSVTERFKFELLARSTLLLFPSRFEGFGYPPLEAALMGTPTVCYDLPVLRETLGELGVFAPIGDVAALADAAQGALAAPTAGQKLRDHADEIAGFNVISMLISRAVASWPSIPASAVTHVVHWGPWTVGDQSNKRSYLPAEDVPLPPYAVVGDVVGAELSVTIRLWTRRPIAAAIVRTDAAEVPASAEQKGSGVSGWIRTAVHFRLETRLLGCRLSLEYRDVNGKSWELDARFMVCEIRADGRME